MASTEEVQEKKKSRVPKALFIVTLPWQTVELGVVLVFLAVYDPSFPNNQRPGVEGYIGRPGGGVESAMREVQNALVYVLFFTTSHWPCLTCPPPTQGAQVHGC